MRAARYLGTVSLLATAATMLAALASLEAAPSVGSAAKPFSKLAGCGGVARATPHNWHRHYRAPLAIGDSTMLLSLPVLSREGFAANAHGCRQYSEALSLLSGLRAVHQLPHLVVIALGANGAIVGAQVEETLRILGPERQLVLVTQRQSGADVQVERAAARRFSAQVRVLDWVAYSSVHSEWFQPDGLHLTFAGAAGFAKLLARALPLAGPFRRTPPPVCRAQAPGPSRPLVNVKALVPRGVLHLHPASPRVPVALINTNPFIVVGIARLHYAAVGGRTIASGCVSVPASSRTSVPMTLDQPALADLQLRTRYRVRLVLTLAGPEGAAGTISATYLLK